MFDSTTRGGHRGRPRHPHTHGLDGPVIHPRRGGPRPFDPAVTLSIELPGSRRMRGLAGHPGGPRPGGPGGPDSPFDGRHGHGDGPRGHRGGRHQARRGAIRHAILTLLAEQPMHGYQVMQELATRSGGRWAPSAGSVYPTLQQLEDEGLVSAVDDGGRKTFELTDAGRTAVAAMPTERPWSGSSGGADLRGLMRELGTAAIQVARVGSPAATEEARTVLVDARRRLYRILAEDGQVDGPAADAAAPDTATPDTAE